MLMQTSRSNPDFEPEPSTKPKKWKSRLRYVVSACLVLQGFVLALVLNAPGRIAPDDIYTKASFAVTLMCWGAWLFVCTAQKRPGILAEEQFYTDTEFRETRTFFSVISLAVTTLTIVLFLLQSY